MPLAGVADDSLMLYITGAIAFARGKVSQGFHSQLTCSGTGCTPGDVFAADNFSASSSKILTGYVIGGGVEMKFSESISGRAEYLYYDFGRYTFSLDGSDVNTAIDQNVFRVGLSYYLN